MTAPAFIKQADLERIFKAAKAADVRVRIEVAREGKIIILPLRDDESSVVDSGDRWV